MRSRIVLSVLLAVSVLVGCNLFGGPGEARIEQTRTDLRVIQAAATVLMVQNPGQCPSSVAALVQGGTLSDSARTEDAWGSEFSIQCQDGEPVVISPGPDRRLGTDDDLRASYGE